MMGSLHNNVENAGEDERDIVDGNITEQSAGEGAMKSQDKSSQDMDTSRPEIHTQSIEGQEIEDIASTVWSGAGRTESSPKPPRHASARGRSSGTAADAGSRSPVPPAAASTTHAGQARTSKPIGTHVTHLTMAS